MNLSNSGTDIIILVSSDMDWVEALLKKSCDKTLTKGEVLHSLFHMIEVNENTLNHIQTESSMGWKMPYRPGGRMASGTLRTGNPALNGRGSEDSDMQLQTSLHAGATGMIVSIG